MTNKKLIVVHGMGTHDENSVEAEINGAFEVIFSRYSSLKNATPKDKFDLVPFQYNSFFEDYRKAITQSADVLEALSAVPGIFSEFADLERSLAEDKFFNTHWLDVILYRYSLLSEPIRLELAAKIVESVKAVGSSNVHIIGHSLGTALLHDTLAKLYGPEPTDTKLSNTSQRLGGVHQVSNVSRLLQSFRKVGASEVRPATGCCSVFFEYRHKLDPFTKIKPFDPTDNGEWISHDAWNASYRLIEPSSVTDANVHSLSHYLINPLVHLPLMRFLFGFRPLKAEKDAALTQYLQGTLEGKAIALREAFETFEFDEKSVKNLLRAGKTLKDTVENLGDSFR